jgi:siderophore synthetase component
MHQQLARQIDPALLARHEAGRRSMETLLNCYCREVAGPQGQLHIGPLFGQTDWPQSVHVAMRSQGGSAMHITLPMTEGRLLTVVEHASPTGNYRYRSPFYHKAPGKPWALLDGEALTALLLREMALQTDTPPNDELRAQIRDSVTVTAAILQSAQPGPFPADPLQAYIASEQSLVYGHPFHPAPKSRQGVSHEDMLRYSPELGAGFPLHYFAVRREFLLQQSLLADACDRIVASQAPGLCDEAEYALMPTHPWQARTLLAHPDVQAALKDGRLRDLGMQGEEYLPTSSIRTLFHPDNPYFYKCSLNIRITNCVRKNAVYELEGALQVTRLMRTLLPDLRAHFPDLEVMEEPAYQSVNLQLGDAQRDKEITEGFGMILRRGFDESLRPGATPLLAGALFGNHSHGEARMRELLQSFAMPYRTAAEQWFSEYAERLMMPVLHCYFAYGVVFEPHLQNVVIAVDGQGPQQLYLRDFEGVKLVRERHGEDRLQEVSQRARDALWYGADLGWNRIVYCLFVNNLCEAIAQLGAGDPALQQRLWRIVRAQLERYQQLHGDAASAARIQPLLNGLPFAGKTNLLNRFFKRADRATTYVPVANPLQSCLEDAAWN